MTERDVIGFRILNRCSEAVEWDIARGRRAYREQQPKPPHPTDKDADDVTREFCYWIGYMLERGKVLMEQWRVEQYLNNPDPNEPRPKAPLRRAA